MSYSAVYWKNDSVCPNRIYSFNTKRKFVNIVKILLYNKLTDHMLSCHTFQEDQLMISTDVQKAFVEVSLRFIFPGYMGNP